MMIVELENGVEIATLPKNTDMGIGHEITMDGFLYLVVRIVHTCSRVNMASIKDMVETTRVTVVTK